MKPGQGYGGGTHCIRGHARAFYLRVRATLLAGLTPARMAVNLMDVRDVLLIRNDRVGDMVLTTPLIRALKQGMPGARLTVLASPSNAAVLDNNPFVERVVVSGAGLLGAARTIRAGRYDLAIDTVHSYALAPALLTVLSRARYRMGFEIAGRGALFNLPCPAGGGDKHLVEHNLDIARCIGLPVGGLVPEIFLADEEVRGARAMMESAGVTVGEGRGALVAMHPGGYYPSQRWPARRFGELAKRVSDEYGARPVFFAGGDERWMLEEAASEARAPMVSFAGLGLREFIAALSLCDVFVGNNSGPLHCASALGLPTVSFAGPTDAVLFAPYGPGHRVLSADVPCIGCGRGCCEDMECMKAITVELATSAVGEAIRGLEVK